MKRKPNCKFSIETEKEIVEKYNDGTSSNELGKIYGCDPSTILNILKAYKTERRSLSQARRNACDYKLNENVFQHIDSPDAAYWLGVMYTDGYISKSNQYTNYFGLTVSSVDIEWLEKFKDFLETNISIKTYIQKSGYAPGAQYSRILIGNNKIVEDLERAGVVEHKTRLINAMPNIQFKDDFIRGVIDGDGSLRKDRPSIRIYGNKPFLQDIADYLRLPYSIIPDKSIFVLEIKTRKANSYLEKRLYCNSKYYLLRKYNLAKRSFTSPYTLEDVLANPE